MYKAEWCWEGKCSGTITSLTFEPPFNIHYSSIFINNHYMRRINLKIPLSSKYCYFIPSHHSKCIFWKTLFIIFLLSKHSSLMILAQRQPTFKSSYSQIFHHFLLISTVLPFSLLLLRVYPNWYSLLSDSH